MHRNCRATPKAFGVALREVAFYLQTCLNIKLPSLGNAAISRSNIRNTRAITLGNLTEDTKCRHQPRPLIWAIQTLSIPKRLLSHRSRAVTCSRFWRLRVTRSSVLLSLLAT